MPAGAAEVLKTALGVTGGQIADERDRQEALQGAQEDSRYRSGRILQSYAMAGDLGDAAGQQRAHAAAQPYDHDHPDAPVSSRLASFVAARQQKALIAASQGQGATFGLRPTDVFGHGVIRF